MAYFTKSGKRLFTAQQVEAYFKNSFWSEYNMTEQDEPNGDGGARFFGYGQFHLGDFRISTGAKLMHLSAAELNELAEKKNKPLSKCRHYRGGHTNDRNLTKQNIDFMEQIDSMEIGDGSTSHDQAFDNQEAVA